MILVSEFHSAEVATNVFTEQLGHVAIDHLSSVAAHSSIFKHKSSALKRLRS